jgi:L-lactate dehydrogenase
MQVMQGVGRQLVLVDKNAARAEAETDDIRHAVPSAHPLEVRSGDYDAPEGCRVVPICAGVGQKPMVARNPCERVWISVGTISLTLEFRT